MGYGVAHVLAGHPGPARLDDLARFVRGDFLAHVPQRRFPALSSSIPRSIMSLSGLAPSGFAPVSRSARAWCVGRLGSNHRGGGGGVLGAIPLLPRQ